MGRLIENIFSIRFKPAIILGNGPSLSEYDLKTDFQEYDTFGMNAAYRYWHEINWFPNYYSCLDEVVGQSHKEAIEDLINNSNKYGINWFLLRDSLISSLDKKLPLNKVWNFDLIKMGLPILSIEPVTTGSHTAAWAVFLGYKKINIIGVDCNYIEKVEGSASLQDERQLIILEEKKNLNYFFEGYQKVGDKYQVPNFIKDLHLRSWDALSNFISESQYQDVQLFNSNKNSRMKSFPYEIFIIKKI